MHFYGWQKGLKTGMYYLRSKAAVDPIKFTLSQKHQRVGTKEAVGATVASPATSPTEALRQQIEEPDTTQGQVCNLDDPDCLMCGS